MAARRHYEGTTVSETSSLTEIDSILRRHGVKTTRWTNATDWLRLEFTWQWKDQPLSFRIDLDIPTVLDGYSLTSAKREAERRRRLRVLLNHIKAKLIAVEDGLIEMEQEFLPYLLMAGDQTVGEMVKEQMPAAITEGRLAPIALLKEGR